jgi:hypothetical protein
MVTMDWLAQMLRNLLYSIFTVQLTERPQFNLSFLLLSFFLVADFSAELARQFCQELFKYRIISTFNTVLFLS